MTAVDTMKLDDPSFLLPSPQAQMAALRRESPVCYDARTDAWLVSRYEDVAYALRHPAIFVSGLGVSAEDRVHAPTEPVHGGDFMLASDAPRHTELRAAVQPGYVQPRIRYWEQRLLVAVRDVVRALPEDEPVDVHAHVSKVLAISTVCDFLGVPDHDVAWIDQMTQVWSPASSTWSGEAVEDYPAGTLDRYFAELIRQREQVPTDDVISVIAGGRGADLSLRAKVLLCIDLVVAGNEPTAAGISGGLLALAEHPDGFDRLADDPSLIPTAVNELLRRVSPVPYMCRTAVEDVELSGTVIPAGSFVYLLYVSANHDEEIWVAPQTLDVGRSDAGKLLTFGRGAHTCIGAPLVRQLYRILLEELTQTFSSMRVGGEVEIVSGVHMPHLGRLPLVLTRKQPTTQEGH